MTQPTPSELFAAALAESPSPLAEVDPASIDILDDERLAELFNTPPNDMTKLTDENIAQMARYYRSRRAQFLQMEEKRAAEPPKRRGGAKPKTVAEALQTTDLDGAL